MTRLLYATLLASLLPLAGAPGARAADLDDFPPPPVRYERPVVVERPVIVERRVFVERPVLERRVLVERPVLVPPPFYPGRYGRSFDRPYPRAYAHRYPPFDGPHRFRRFADGPRFERPYGY